jgi:hypothetical protein
LVEVKSVSNLSRVLNSTVIIKLISYHFVLVAHHLN